MFTLLRLLVPAPACAMYGTPGQQFAKPAMSFQIRQLVCASALRDLTHHRLLSCFLWRVADLTEGHVNEQSLLHILKSFAIQSLPPLI